MSALLNGAGAALLLAPVAYAVVMAGLRRHWQQLRQETLEAEAASIRPSGSPSPEERGPGGEVTRQHDSTQSKALGELESAAEKQQENETQRLIFSVLIAARNEAATLPLLLADLAAQTLAPAQFEVLVVDDHSTDGTAAVVTAAARAGRFSLRLLPLAQESGSPQGKKAALLAALAQARAPWVVCTDADCRVGPDWLAAYAARRQRAPGLRFLSGPVLLTLGGAWWQPLVGLEFAGLVGVGAACLAAGQPTMCNGANLAYERAAFRAVGGFAGNEQVASGDDEFLLHKLHAAFPGSVGFLAAEAAMVRTAAPPTLAALLRQRVRWASKWRHYQAAAPRRLALLVLAANLSLGGGLLAALPLPALRPWVAAAWLLKLGADAWFLAPVLGFLRRRRWLALAPLLQLAYGPYALGVGLAGWRGGYQWKGRMVR